MKKIVKKKKEEKPKSKTKTKKRGWKIFWLSLILIILAVMGLGFGLLIGIINTTPLVTADQLKFRNLTTTFYDSQGTEIAKVFGEENRSIVSLENITDDLKQAFIDIEDERFKTHSGVDIKRTISATANYALKLIGLSNNSYGGSTITQQLVKNVTKEDKESSIRKIREMWRAINLERQLTKDEILEAYLNTIFLGENAYGVQAAARTYFDKDAKNLTLAESALIAGITQFPTLYNPFINFEKSKAKQELVLGKMYELGHISKEEYEQAKNEEIVLKKGKDNSESELLDVEAQTYFVDAVSDQVLNDLVDRNGISYAMAQKMLNNDGLKIYTTLDQNIQEILDSVYENPDVVFSTYYGSREDLQSAMAIVDYRTGNVVALAGGVGEKKLAKVFNRAVEMKRQPGSSIKPIGVYAPGLELGKITASTVVVDEPITIGKWSPRNSNGKFSGPMTIRSAIQWSNNIIAVKVLQMIGIDNSYSFLEKFGLKSLVSDDRVYPALALGGLTRGVSPLEMASAFGTIANDGYYIEPMLYTKVVDSEGQVILQNGISVRKVISEKNAYSLTDMLSDVVTYGTGGSASLGAMPVAGKTGTTTNDVDRWFVGYTPYYAAATWIGYENDDNVTKRLPSGANYSAQIWQKVMAKIHSTLPVKTFTKPDGVYKASYCIDSNKIATDLCEQDPRGSRVKTEWVSSSEISNETCDIHKEILVCKVSGLLAGENCPQEDVYTRVVVGQSTNPTDVIGPSEYCNIH